MEALFSAIEKTQADDIVCVVHMSGGKEEETRKEVTETSLASHSNDDDAVIFRGRREMCRSKITSASQSHYNIVGDGDSDHGDFPGHPLASSDHNDHKSKDESECNWKDDRTSERSDGVVGLSLKRKRQLTEGNRLSIKLRRQSPDFVGRLSGGGANNVDAMPLPLPQVRTVLLYYNSPFISHKLSCLAPCISLLTDKQEECRGSFRTFDLAYASFARVGASESRSPNC
jgi:hypothetical protein